MKIAHLILAHKAPAQLERLLGALAHSEADSFIHLDKKTDAAPFASLATRPQVAFTHYRLDVKWGGYSLTLAALEGLREILRAPVAYDFVNVMSGEDYPIKPIPVIHRFFEANLGQSFLEYDAPGSAWWLANQERVAHYHLTEFTFPGRYLAQRLINSVLPRRTPPLPALYGGNMGGWYTLSRAAAAYVVAYIDSHPRLQRFARLTWGSDEFLVHSILLNSPLAATITNNNLRHIDWSGGGSSPKLLTAYDLPALAASPRLFARKFDSQRHPAVLDELDLLNR